MSFCIKLSLFSNLSRFHEANKLWLRKSPLRPGNLHFLSLGICLIARILDQLYLSLHFIYVGLIHKLILQYVVLYNLYKRASKIDGMSNLTKYVEIFTVIVKLPFKYTKLNDKI
ncbi:hypothetical protein NIES4103_52420 [Nostoc sp. NIES-4103]|nr:hypothetical protein NIES4103_52420 [Nostoc sp. NIES-4103]